MDQKCQDKIPFRTKAEAEGASVMARYRYGSDKHKIYKCKQCEMWHLARKKVDD